MSVPVGNYDTLVYDRNCNVIVQDTSAGDVVRAELKYRRRRAKKEIRKTEDVNLRLRKVRNKRVKKVNSK